MALGLCVWLVIPAQALARAVVRFVHAVPGVGAAQVSVDDGGGARNVGSISFGRSTRWHSIRSGRFRWSLSGAGGTVARGTATVGSGAYDLLVLERGSKVVIGVYRARAGRPGTALVRVIHGAPELGSPELTVDGKIAVRSLAYTRATPYVSLTPGVHTLGADRPGDSTPLVSGAATMVRAGRSYSAIVLGTRGQRVRVVTLVDRGGPLVRPSGAHATPRSPTGSPSAPGSTIVVRAGDSLWSIARRLAGPRASDEIVARRLVSIWNANERRIGTGDPNLIFPGTRLRV